MKKLTICFPLSHRHSYTGFYVFCRRVLKKINEFSEHAIISQPKAG